MEIEIDGGDPAIAAFNRRGSQQVSTSRAFAAFFVEELQDTFLYYASPFDVRKPTRSMAERWP